MIKEIEELREFLLILNPESEEMKGLREKILEES
jgi:hypothetical protein